MSPWIFSLLLTLPAQPPVEWIAHRGESADAPENTMAAFRSAWERNVDAIELDVHLSQDDRLIVCHDGDTKRTTGAAHLIKQTAAAALTKLDAGAWKGERFAGERMPLLDDVLAAIPEGKRCYIEVKVGPEAIPALVKAVEASGKSAAQLPIISFNEKTTAEAKRRLPKHQAFLISGFKRDKLTGEWSPTIDQLIAAAQRIGADGLDLAHDGPLDAAAVKKIREAKLGLYVWTVDSVPRARELLELGVDGITSNRAAFVRDELKR